MARDWNNDEIDAIVADYFAMLGAELRGEPYNKSEHRRALVPKLRGRSPGSVERKHQNISAVLRELGFPFIDGYKPLSRRQQLLFDVVETRLNQSRDLETVVSAELLQDVDVPSFDDILRRLVDPPVVTEKRDRVRDSGSTSLSGAPRRPRVNYFEREAANAALGLAGEEFVLNYERARLCASGRELLAGRIEHVSRTRGDGDGFDILSFEENGAERLIEVKTTRNGSQAPFFVTRNELDVSRRESDRYNLYRVFGFRAVPRVFIVPGSFTDHFHLDPTQYMARIA